MRIGGFAVLAVVIGVALAACGKSYSTQNVGYRGYTIGNAAAPANGSISPPSSGTSNGTGTAAAPHAK